VTLRAVNPTRVVTRLLRAILGLLLRPLTGLLPGVVLLPVMALMGLFDDGGDGGDSGDGGDDDDPPAGGDDGADDEPPAGGATVTMSQAELDALIDKRLGRAKTKWEADAQTAAERAKMDEAQRAAADKADAEQAAATALATATAAKVEAAAVRAAIKADIDPDRVDRFLHVAGLDAGELVDDDGTVDTAAVAKAIKAAATDWPEFVRKSGPGRSGGDLNGGSDEQPKTLAEAVTRRLATTP
jgi:hypothetical protein